MASKDYSEDALIQAPTADFLAQQLGWETVFAQDEGGFGPDSLLGRASEREVVLSRDVMAALRRILVEEKGCDPQRVRAAAYWKHRVSAHHENLEG